MPKGLKMKKFIEGPEGTLIHDKDYVGEDAWDEDNDDDGTVSKNKVKEIIESDTRLNTRNKKELQEELGLSGKFVMTSYSCMFYDVVILTVLCGRC